MDNFKRDDELWMHKITDIHIDKKRKIGVLEVLSTEKSAFYNCFGDNP